MRIPRDAGNNVVYVIMVLCGMGRVTPSLIAFLSSSSQLSQLGNQFILSMITADSNLFSAQQCLAHTTKTDRPDL
jgi:hypothetical protein